MDTVLAAATSPFDLLELLARLRQEPDVRQELVEEVMKAHYSQSHYLTRDAAEQTARALLRSDR